MAASESSIDILDELDKYEKNRKADYSIWGYLYQFDLMFYDMLTDRKKDDLFNDYPKLEDSCDVITYEAEMIEDYCKKFIINDQKHVRLAQIKYNARSYKNFYKENSDALKTLYYVYLKAKIIDCEWFDLKCSLFYFNQNKNNHNNKDYSDEIKKELNIIIKKESKKLQDILDDESNIEIDEWVASTIDNEIIFNKLGKKDLSGRIQYLFYNLSNDEYLDDFIDNKLIIRKVEERQELINIIKQILEEDYAKLIRDDYSLSRDINKGDLLYSLGINFIINEWQSKKIKNDRKPIELPEIIEYIKSVNSTDISVDHIIEKTLVEYFEQLNKIIEDNIYEEEIEKDLEEEQVDNIIENYQVLLHELLKFMKYKMKEKKNRYSLFNTIAEDRFRNRAEYMEISPIDEYGLINQMKGLFIDFCRRTLKIMYWEKYIQKKEINLEKWFRLEDELWIFTKTDLKTKGILLPNANDDRVRDICRDIVYRMRKVNEKYSKPRVWYFKNIGKSKQYSHGVPYSLREKLRRGEMHYSLNISNIPDENVRNNIAGYNEDSFYIECMNCLKMESMLNHELIEHLFSERCVGCGIKKCR